MVQFKQSKFFPLLFLVMLIGFYCKKTSTDNSSKGNLQIIKSSSLANSRNALQATYLTNDNSFKGYYYGTFNSNGEPDSIKSLVIQKLNGDTSINMTFDENLKVKSIYMRYGAKRDTTLFSCDYSVANQTYVKVYFYDSATSMSRLKYEYKVNNSTMSVISSKQYASIGGGLLNIFNTLLQINTNPTPDPWMSQFITTQGAISIINTVTIGVGIWGCTISFPACGLGLAAAYFVGLNNANASTVSTLPNGPNSPTEPHYKVGDIFGGGVIISLDNMGLHGVISSTADQSTGTTWTNAFTVASSYRGGGFSNWRLPTYGEISTLYFYNALVGNFNSGCDNSNFTQCTYWSSDQNGGGFAWAMYFTNGTFWSNYGTSANARVRAVRSF